MHGLLKVKGGEKKNEINMVCTSGTVTGEQGRCLECTAQRGRAQRVTLNAQCYKF